MGPSLPQEMHEHCQLTVNSTHVFFAMPYSPSSYLLDWYEETWTELPPTTVGNGNQMCGLINNPENGLEAVIVEDGYSEIFNFNSLAWRDGPTLEPFDQAGFAQVGDTFVLVGGWSYEKQRSLDTIYRFDHLNYEWILMEQHLQIPIQSFPAVVAVPDDFVSCS